VLAAEELSAGGLTGTGWQMLGGLAICAVAVAAALLGRRDGGAGQAPSSGPAGPDQSVSADESGVPGGALVRPAVGSGRAAVGSGRAAAAIGRAAVGSGRAVVRSGPDGRVAAGGGPDGRVAAGGGRAGRVAGRIGADERRQFDEIVSRLTADYPSLARPVWPDEARPV